jgi:hypothetical protein
MLMTLRAFFSWAVESEPLNDSPVRSMTMKAVAPTFPMAGILLQAGNPGK